MAAYVSEIDFSLNLNSSSNLLESLNINTPKSNKRKTNNLNDANITAPKRGEFKIKISKSLFI